MKETEIIKDDLLEVQFPDNDVLESETGKSHRWLQLKAATYKEKNTSSKLNIFFEGVKKGKLHVESKILVTKPKYIILTGGYVIPMRSIYKVE